MDVATGTLFNDIEDYTMPGAVPLSVQRRYSTELLDAERTSMFGRGWDCPLQAYLRRTDTHYGVSNGSGKVDLAFPTTVEKLNKGERVLAPGSFADLSLDGDEICVTRWDPDTGEIAKDFFDAGTGPDWSPIRRRENAEGIAIDFQYSGNSGLLKYVVQTREERGFQFQYNSEGRVLQVFRRSRRGPKDNKPWLRYSYNASGFLETFTDPMGNRACYRYDSQGRMVNEITLAGKEWGFRFDESGRCVESTAENKFDYHHLEYDDQAKLTREFDSYGNMTRYHWNASGQVHKVVSPLGHESRTVFDTVGRIVQEVTAGGRVTAFEYDNAGNRCGIVERDGARLRYEFNEDHQVTSLIDPLGNEWRRDYDRDGRLTSLTNPLGVEQSFAYNLNGDLIVHEDGLGQTRRFHWERGGGLVSATGWTGNPARYEWDAYGYLTKFIDQGGSVTEVRRDRLGRLEAVTLPDGSTREYEWDVFDNITRYVNERKLVSTWQYCDCGNLEVETLADGTQIFYGWNAVPGQLAVLTNQRKKVFDFDYDADGRLVAERDYFGSVTRYEYDPDNNLTKTVKPSGKEIRFEHDGAGRVVSISYSGGEKTAFTFDSRGLMLTADNGRCPASFTYDELGRVTREVQGDHELFHEYDVLNRRIRRDSTLNDSTAFEWTPDGQIARIVFQEQAEIGFDYDVRGHEEKRSFETLVLTRRTDSRGRLTSQHLNADDRGVVERSYRYDVAGNLIGKSDSLWGKTHYVYDELERVSHTFHPDGQAEHFEYDGAHNIVGYLRAKYSSAEFDEVNLADFDRREHSAGNRIRCREGVRYEYDADGQLIRRFQPDGVSSFTWNHAGQLAGFEKPNGDAWRYSYDALGRRVLKEGPGDRRDFLWDGDVVLYEFKGTAESERVVECWEYHPHDFSPLCKAGGGQRHLCVNDQVGTPMELVDGRGKIDWSQRSLTFGETRKARQQEIECCIRFQGQWFDAESGLCYNRFRYYDAAAGSYVSDDPIGLAGGVNTRSYARNTTEWIDVFGLAKKKCKKVVRYLSADDRERLDAGLGLEPKGSGGSILDHVQGKPTRHISASETREAASRFDSGHGYVEIDVSKATQGDTNFIDHNNVVQAVGSDLTARRDARRAEEVLFRGPVPANAIGGPFDG